MSEDMKGEFPAQTVKKETEVETEIAKPIDPTDSMKAFIGEVGADAGESSGPSASSATSPIAASSLSSEEQHQDDAETLEKVKADIKELERERDRLLIKQWALSKLSADEILHMVHVRALMAEYMTNPAITNPAQSVKFHDEIVEGLQLLASKPMVLPGTDWVPKHYQIPDIDYERVLEVTKVMRGVKMEE